MLSSLANLNSQLLSTYYSPDSTNVAEVQQMLRNANALHARAQLDVHTAVNQDRFSGSEDKLTQEAIMGRHVSKHTSTPNSLCMGPCVHTTREFMDSIRDDLQELHGKNRIHAIENMVRKMEYMPRTANESDPRLCEGTQVACVMADFEKSNDYKNLNKQPQRAKTAEQVLKEAQHTLDMAKMVATSHVRELEAGAIHTVRLDTELSGGGVPTPSRESIRDFFHTNQLGQIPDTADIRVAIDFVTKKVAPRSRVSVRNDIWARWLHV